KGTSIAEERCLIVGHRLHDFSMEVAERTATQASDHLQVRRKPFLAGQRLEARFDQVLLAGLQGQGAPGANQFSNVIEIVRHHRLGAHTVTHGVRRWRETRSMMSAPNSESGSTRVANPARATIPDKPT